MPIRSVLAGAVRVPMSVPFVHAGAARRHCDSVLVRVDVDGTVGWGEAAPRRYVTGETAEGVLSDLAALDIARLSSRIDSSSFDSALASMAALDLPALLGRGRPHPAAASAVECALLDAVCRGSGRSFGDALDRLGLAYRPLPADRPIRVSTVLDLSRGVEQFLAATAPGLLATPRLVKLKASADPDRTVQEVRRLAEALPGPVRLAVDANGAWPPAVALETAARLADLPVAWLEEPTTPRSWDLLRAIRRRSAIGIMLDESFTGAADVPAAASGAATHLNLRVSKCGGLLGAARLAALARSHGLRYQVGVHVGEVGPLWAAARWLAAALGDAEAVEGGQQDRWFPVALTVPAYTADRVHGTVAQLRGPGSGVVPSDELLRHFRAGFTWERGADHDRRRTARTPWTAAHAAPVAD
ncbi:MAG: L-Ala-D/L-Glu epimerase [Micromonosporaceae bacterium]